MAVGERIAVMPVLEEERPASVAEASGFVWRLEYTLLIGVMLLLTAFAITFFYFSANIESLKSYGYAGLFLINIIGAASILLPSPAGATVVGGGALLEDFLGIPAFVWVGLVAGLGEAIGEFSGYAAGYGGRFIIQEKPAYARIHDWMVKRGVITMFLMSTVPNPLFDVAGLPRALCRCRCAAFSYRYSVERSSRTRGWPPLVASAWASSRRSCS